MRATRFGTGAVAALADGESGSMVALSPTAKDISTVPLRSVRRSN
jgi:hypothetical protein